MKHNTSNYFFKITVTYCHLLLADSGQMACAVNTESSAARLVSKQLYPYLREGVTGEGKLPRKIYGETGLKCRGNYHVI